MTTLYIWANVCVRVLLCRLNPFFQKRIISWSVWVVKEASSAWALCVCMHMCSAALVMPNSLQPHGLQPSRLLCPWNFQDIPFSRGSSQSRDWTWVLHIAGRFFTTGPSGKPSLSIHLQSSNLLYNGRYTCLFNHFPIIRNLTLIQ